MRGKLVHELKLLVRVRVWRWVRVMVQFGTSSAFRRWVRVRVLGYGFGVRSRKVMSRDCALASDLVRASPESTPNLSRLVVVHCRYPSHPLLAPRNSVSFSKNRGRASLA